MATASLTAARLRELLAYDPETGSFTWLQQRPKAITGRSAGCLNKTLGYIVIGVEGTRYYAHRLAFLWMTGAWPLGQADHINGNRADNCWSNLRDVTGSVNLQNVHKARRHNASGMLGVRKARVGSRWDSMITVNKRLTYIGSFSSPEEAHEAYLEAKRRLHAGNTL